MVSVIGTVLNENENIAELLSDLESQSKKPDEITFVDAGSHDGTVQILQGKVKLIEKSKVGRSEGRNIAIKESGGVLIVVCDGGTRISHDFVEKITHHFSNPSVDVVSGFFKPKVENFFEKCLASTTIPILEEIEEDKFLPSSRSVAFRKKVWEKVGGYPEWLSVCEDLVFDIKLKKNNCKFKFEPLAIAFWRPRKDVYSFFNQYFMYARGDGHAKLWFLRHLIRYTSYFTGFLLLYLSFKVSGLWLLPFFAAQLGYFSKFFYRFMGHFEDESEFSHFLAFPLISFLVVVGDIAKMVGYPIGVYERVSGKVRFEKY